MRRFKQLKKNDRYKIDFLLRKGYSKKEIAEEIGVHISTIYRELKRGIYEHRNSDWTTEIRYSPEQAEERYQENLMSKGPALKIGKDMNLANYIEDMILKNDWSPAAVLGHIKRSGLKFETKICVTTLYSYIDKNIFLTLTNKNLPEKKKKKRKYRKVKVQKSSSRGTSIEKRPKEVESREEFGHWEMDTVIGQRGISKNVLLVLTERKTRMEILEKMPDKTTGSVKRCLNRIERRLGSPLFRKTFKTITVDNGTEFSDYEGFETSYRKGKKKRSKVYFCHPYSSYERGTNEVTNKMVRRKVPKGTDFDDKTNKEIKEIEKWINTYPRGILDYCTAEEAFEREMAALI